MIDLLSKKANSGDLYINLAVLYLEGHEWGRAKMAIEKGLTKGGLVEPEKAFRLLRDVCQRMGVSSHSSPNPHTADPDPSPSHKPHTAHTQYPQSAPPPPR
jgi:hypothetical protein